MDDAVSGGIWSTCRRFTLSRHNTDPSRCLASRRRRQAPRNLGINLTGNFVRSTGAGEISGELPNFGPLTWPLATGTVYYDFARFGRLSIDLQRTYYLEEIVRGNDFRANLLTIRWTRDF